MIYNFAIKYTVEDTTVIKFFNIRADTQIKAVIEALVLLKEKSVAEGLKIEIKEVIDGTND